MVNGNTNLKNKEIEVFLNLLHAYKVYSIMIQNQFLYNNLKILIDLDIILIIKNIIKQNQCKIKIR